MLDTDVLTTSATEYFHARRARREAARKYARKVRITLIDLVDIRSDIPDRCTGVGEGDTVRP